MSLSAALHSVAMILDAQPVEVVGLTVRRSYPHESVSAVVSVSVHLSSAKDVDLVADRLALARSTREPVPELYSREGDWRCGVYVDLFGPAVPVSAKADAASCKAAV